MPVCSALAFWRGHDTSEVNMIDDEHGTAQRVCLTYSRSATQSVMQHAMRRAVAAKQKKALVDGIAGLKHLEAGLKQQHPEERGPRAR